MKSCAAHIKQSTFDVNKFVCKQHLCSAGRASLHRMVVGCDVSELLLGCSFPNPATLRWQHKKTAHCAIFIMFNYLVRWICKNINSYGHISHIQYTYIIHTTAHNHIIAYCQCALIIFNPTHHCTAYLIPMKTDTNATHIRQSIFDVNKFVCEQQL